MKHIPIALIAFRFCIAPIILWIAAIYGEKEKFLIITLVWLGLFSDILDGIIARKQQVSSANLRRLDSQTDMIFWVSTGVATYWLYPQTILTHQNAIFFLFFMEFSCYLVSILKFGKETCTHAYLSKFWGITLLLAFTDLILYNNIGFCFHFCIVAGIISHLDRILITLFLPHWTHDVPSAYHAWLIRKGKSFERNVWFNG